MFFCIWSALFRLWWFRQCRWCHWMKLARIYSVTILGLSWSIRLCIHLSVGSVCVNGLTYLSIPFIRDTGNLNFLSTHDRNFDSAQIKMKKLGFLAKKFFSMRWRRLWKFQFRNLFQLFASDELQNSYEFFSIFGVRCKNVP